MQPLQTLTDLRTSTRVVIRRLRRHPVRSVGSITTIAVGIGALGAALLVANQALWRPLQGIADPETLVGIRMTNSQGAFSYASPALLDRLSRTGGTEGLAGSAARTMQLAVPGRSPFVVRGGLVSPRYFSVTGVRPALGRLLSEAELSPESDARVVVISGDLWRRRFGRDSAIIASSLLINGVRYTVVGVAGAGFRGVDRQAPEALWVSLGGAAALMHTARSPVPETVAASLRLIVARLRPGVGADAAQARLRAAFRRVSAEVPRTRASFRPTIVRPVGIAHPRSQESLTRAVLALGGIATLVLLAALANLLNLLLLGSFARRDELAIRCALGAPRWRLLCQHGLDIFPIALAGTGVGMALAIAVARGLSSGRLGGLVVATGGSLDWTLIGRVAAAGTLGVVALGVLAGQLTMRGVVLGPVPRGTRQSTARNPVGMALCMLQVGASTALLVGGLLLLRTVSSLRSVSLGFDPRSVYTYLVSPGAQGYDADAQQRLATNLLAALNDRPGIRVAVATAAPLSGREGSGYVDLPGTTNPGTHAASAFEVSPEFFELLGMRLVAGRVLTPADARSVGASGPRADPSAMVIDQRMARRLFGSTNPIGQTLECCYMDHRLRTVVGVVENGRLVDLRDTSASTVYLPRGALSRESLDFFVLVRSSAAVATDSLVLRALRRFDPRLPVVARQALTEVVRESMSEERMLMWLVGTLAGAVALLTGIGLYSVIGTAVAQRTREIGIRIALGASPRDAAGMVLRRSAFLVTAGLALGIAASVLLMGLLKARLYGVGSLDILSYSAAISIVAGLAAGACLVPALRAAAVDPSVALRAE